MRLALDASDESECNHISTTRNGTIGIHVNPFGCPPVSGIFLSNFQGGAFEILDFFFKQISGLLKKLWTFQYAAWFRGPGILIKRSTIVDLSVYAAWLRGPDISQNIQKIFKKYPKIDYRAFASSHRHYAADNRTARDIQNVGPFWVVKIQGGGGNDPLAPLIKISLCITFWKNP